MKLFTVIAYYITSITKQLKLLDSHCSIVCSYCFVVCLIAKNGLKIIEFSSSLKLNETHMVDRPFNEDPKNIIFSQLGTGGKFKKNGNSRDIYCFANRGVVNFEREYQLLPPGTKILVIPQFSYMPEKILGKTMKKLNFWAKV